MRTIDTILFRAALGVVLAVAPFGATPAYADVCGCAGHPGSLGAFDSADPATWPTVGGRPTTQAGSVITLPLPDDGVLIFDSFQLSDLPGGGNATVAFERDRANPPVRLLVAGDMRIGVGDVITVAGTTGQRHAAESDPDAAGLGGPGGYRGGDCAAPFYNEQTLGGFGFGPGGGAPGLGLSANQRVAGEPGRYGGAPDLLPLAGGSGGGGGSSTYTAAARQAAVVVAVAARSSWRSTERSRSTARSAQMAELAAVLQLHLLRVRAAPAAAARSGSLRIASKERDR